MALANKNDSPPDEVDNKPDEVDNTPDEVDNTPVVIDEMGEDRSGLSELQQLDRRINDLMIERDKLDAEIAKYTRKRNAIQTSAYRESTHREDMEGRMGYIRSQAQIRANKAAKARSLLKQVNIADVDPRSPLDKALNARPNRASQRPTRV